MEEPMEDTERAAIDSEDDEVKDESDNRKGTVRGKKTKLLKDEMGSTLWYKDRYDKVSLYLWTLQY
jgi:hypothetical protein